MTHIPKHFHHELVKLLKPALDAGCTYRVTGGQHVLLTNPANGKTLTVSGRNSSRRQPYNVKQQVQWLLEQETPN
jgi:hypothetical protein